MKQKRLRVRAYVAAGIVGAVGGVLLTPAEAKSPPPAPRQTKIVVRMQAASLPASEDTLDTALASVTWDVSRRGPLFVIAPQGTHALPSSEPPPAYERADDVSLRSLAARSWTADDAHRITDRACPHHDGRSERAYRHTQPVCGNAAQPESETADGLSHIRSVACARQPQGLGISGPFTGTATAVPGPPAGTFRPRQLQNGKRGSSCRSRRRTSLSPRSSGPGSTCASIARWRPTFRSRAALSGFLPSCRTMRLPAARSSSRW